jgi:hypothetical protein
MAHLEGVESEKEDRQIIVVQSGDSMVGVMIDELGEIPEVPESFIVKDGLLQDDGNAHMIECIVRPPEESEDTTMLIVLDTESFVGQIIKGKKVELISKDQNVENSVSQLDDYREENQQTSSETESSTDEEVKKVGS